MAVTPQPGDVVLAANKETGEIGYKEVLDTFRNETNVVVHVTVNEETISANMHDKYYKQLHGLVGSGESFRNNPTLNAEYNNFRSQYWRARAKGLGGD